MFYIVRLIKLFIGLKYALHFRWLIYFNNNYFSYWLNTFDSIVYCCKILDPFKNGLILKNKIK